MVWFVASAGAAPVEMKVMGRPFTPVTVLAAPDPQRPGNMVLLLVSERFTCDDLLHPEQRKPSKKKPTLVQAAFPGGEPGTKSELVMIMGADGFGGTGTTGGATLATMPAGGHGTGTVVWDLDGNGKDRLVGEQTFELCAPIPPRPSIDTTFSSQTVTLTEKSVFPDEPPTTHTLAIPLPQGWTKQEGENQMSAGVWMAPDGRTGFSIDYQSAFANLETEGKDWADMQVKAFVGEQTSGELLSARLVNPGTYAIRWRNRWGTNPWSLELVVFRQEPGWATGVTCRLTTDEAGAALLMDKAEAACTAVALQ